MENLDTPITRTTRMTRWSGNSESIFSLKFVQAKIRNTKTFCELAKPMNCRFWRNWLSAVPAQKLGNFFVLLQAGIESTKLSGISVTEFFTAKLISIGIGMTVFGCVCWIRLYSLSLGLDLWILQQCCDSRAAVRSDVRMMGLHSSGPKQAPSRARWLSNITLVRLS